MSAPILLDFHDQPSAKKALGKVAQFMQRAGQPVVSTSFDAKVKRTSGVGYREALLTLASGQTVGLRVTQTGDIFQVLLNGTVKPIKNATDQVKAIGEIAKLAEGNQVAFQKKQARVKVELPKGLKTAAPRMEVALQSRVAELDTQIAERQTQVNELKAELGEPVLDAASPSDVIAWHDGNSYTRDQFDMVPTDEHGEMPPTLCLKADAVPILDAVVLDAAKKFNQKGYAFYVIAKGKIESGWEYDEDAKEHKADNMPDKLKVGAKIVKAATLKKLNLDPNDNASWLTSAALDAVHDGGEEPDLSAAQALAESVLAGTTLDSASTSAAVATLQIALETVETNHVINMSEGNIEQAELEQSNADSFRAALALLDAAALSDPPALPAPDLPVPSEAGKPALAAVAALQFPEEAPIPPLPEQKTNLDPSFFQP